MRLSNGDIASIAAFLGLSEYDFVQRYTRLRPRRDGLALIDKPNGECIFLEGIDCTIQPVKPHQHIFPRHGRMQRGWILFFAFSHTPMPSDGRFGRKFLKRKGLVPRL